MKKIISISLIILLLCTSVKVQGKDLQLGCLAGVLIDADSGRILYEKNCDEKRAMASTTKIMTCITALEYCKPDDVFTVTKNAVVMPKVKMYVKEKEQYYLKDLLYALMLESYNDVAVVIAEGIGGSTKEFAKLMNKKAKELGMKNSHFVTPNGLDAKNHYSTAYDMALLGAYAVKNEKFLNIINKKQHTLKEITTGRKINVYNRDGYLSIDSDSIGIKTGFTNQAGYCFVGAIKSEGRTYISCVLGSGWPPKKNQKWVDTKKLMDYGRNKYEIKQIKLNKTFVFRIDNGKNSEVIAEVSAKKSVLKAKKEKFRYQTQFLYRVPIKKGQVIGTMKVYLDDFCLGKYEIKSKKDVPVYNFKYCVRLIYHTMFFLKKFN